MIIQNIIDKAEVNLMTPVCYEGKIHVAETPQDAERAVTYLRQFPMLGIDTETRPSFRKGLRYQVSLLQVATEQECFLLRLNLTGLTLPVIQLLESPHILKVGLSLKDDFAMLRARSPFQPQAYVELQEYASTFGIEEKSLQKIYALLFGQKISKSKRLSNWDQPKLTLPQQEYAAIDAWACLKIYRKLEELRATGDFVIEKREKKEKTDNE